MIVYLILNMDLWLQKNIILYQELISIIDNMQCQIYAFLFSTPNKTLNFSLFIILILNIVYIMPSLY